MGAQTFGEEIRQVINEGKTSGHLRTGLGQVSFRWKSKLSWQTFRHRTWFCYAPTYTASRLFHASSFYHTLLFVPRSYRVSFLAVPPFFSCSKMKNMLQSTRTTFWRIWLFICCASWFHFNAEKREEWLKNAYSLFCKTFTDHILPLKVFGNSSQMMLPVHSFYLSE